MKVTISYNFWQYCPANLTELQNGEIKDPTISMLRLTVMYKDFNWSFQKSVTTLRKGRFVKHLEYLLKHSALLIKLITTPDMT